MSREDNQSRVKKFKERKTITFHNFDNVAKCFPFSKVRNGLMNSLFIITLMKILCTSPD